MRVEGKGGTEVSKVTNKQLDQLRFLGYQIMGYRLIAPTTDIDYGWYDAKTDEFIAHLRDFNPIHIMGDAWRLMETAVSITAEGVNYGVVYDMVNPLSGYRAWFSDDKRSAEYNDADLVDSPSEAIFNAMLEAYGWNEKSQTTFP